MKALYFSIAILILILGFAANGMYLRVLIQPQIFMPFLLGLFFILSGKYGTKTTARSLLGIGKTPKTFLSDAVLVSSTLGATIFVAGILITFGRIASSKEIIGHNVAAAMVSLLYSFLFSLYLFTLKQVSSLSLRSLSGNSAPALIGAASAMTLFTSVMWFMS